MEQREIHAFLSYSHNRSNNESNKQYTHKTSTAEITTPAAPVAREHSCHATQRPQPHGRLNKDGGQVCNYYGYLATHATCPTQGQECRICFKKNYFARVSKFKFLIPTLMKRYLLLRQMTSQCSQWKFLHHQGYPRSPFSSTTLQWPL